ncbi:hypothetical protein X737_22145 [Mesorhizobium sp. L48C026A00]|nr:hypothetical protein X737_22145 [Mesorhizobium sp. L48C026A00]
MEYRGKEHRGVIQDSDWVVDGKRFKALRRPRKA